ncbi:MAG: CvpA family protein [Clostridiales bacterium]|nr:CvpA family protein [Clostridiales bacterium]
MSWIDVALLALVVLVGLLGLWKGAKKSALSLGAFIVSFVLAFFLSTVIAEALLGIDSIKNFVLGNGVGDKAQWSLANMIYSGIGSMKLDPKSYLFTNFYKPMTDVIKTATSANATIPSSGISVENAGFALYGAFMMFSAICGVGIFIVVRLLLIIVTVIIKSYIGKKKTVVSRLVGFLFGAIRGALWVFAFTIVFSCFGGYTFVPGIQSIQNEYGDKAVMCNYLDDWAYGLRNKLLLPDKDAYGRLVEMVYKKKTADNSKAEKLTGNELNLFINVSNLNYDGAPWSITAQKKRKFDDSDANIKLRVASEFGASGFDTVAQAILDYNTSIAGKIDAQTTGLKSENFTTLNGVTTNINTAMNDLWEKLRTYEFTCTTAPDREKDNWESLLDSKLAGEYKDVTDAIDELKAKYETFSVTFGEKFGEFPILELPERVNASDVPVSRPEQEGPEQEGPEQEGEDNDESEAE